MNLDEARAVARCTEYADRDAALTAAAVLDKELDRVEAVALEQKRRQTLGGPPAAFTHEWIGERDVPAPDSAGNRAMDPPQWRHAPRLRRLPDSAA